jgi:hypothetical protein
MNFGVLMKKLRSAFIVFSLSMVLIVGASFPLLGNVSANQSTTKWVAIYVNSTIYNNISTEISQYQTDIAAQGFNVTNIYNWSDSSVINLKSNISTEYTNNQIEGVILIGNIPYALFDEYSALIYTGFPTELFLMDLDGNWTDPDGDLDYDGFSNGTGDMYPEIFVGRINPYCLSGSNQLDLLKNYFNRIHNYRNGSITLYDSSLMFIDEDWQQWSEEWRGDMLYLFSNITMINTTANTNPSDYMNQLCLQYEFVHAFIHSNQTTHFLKPNYTNPSQQIYYSQIPSLNTKALFYNLYCCYACDFSVTDNLGTHYLFSSNNTLAVFGSTRSGGFLMNRFLYEPLSEGKTLGEAYRYWWSNDVLDNDPMIDHGPNDLNMTGNVLLGDPLLTIPIPSGGLPLELIIIVGAAVAVIVIIGIAGYLIKIRK